MLCKYIELLSLVMKLMAWNRYTRSFLALNKDVLQSDGSINMNTGNPLNFPNDMFQALNAAASSSAAPTASSAATSSAASGSSTPAAAASHNGASAVVASKGLAILMAVIATWFVL
jgi:hypothetical protein